MDKINNDKFSIKWKPLHDKGIRAYVVSNMLYSSIIILGVIWLTNGSLMSNILGFIMTTSMFLVLHIGIWSSKEKKYKEIEKVNAKITR